MDVQSIASLEMAMVATEGGSVQVDVASVDSVSLNFTKIKFDYVRTTNAMVVDVDGGLDLSVDNSECTALVVTNSHSVAGSGLGTGKVSLQDFHFSSVDVRTDSSLELAMVDSEGGSIKMEVASVDGGLTQFYQDQV